MQSNVALTVPEMTSDLPAAATIHMNNQVMPLIQARAFDEVIVESGGRQHHRQISIMVRLSACPIDISLASTGLATSATAIAPVAGAPVTTMVPHPTCRWPFAQKRAVDAILALTGLVALSPLLLLAITAIKLTSRGPAIFKQRRTGLNLSTFEVWKLRTMRIDSSSVERPFRQAQYGDERVTAIGRILRKYSIDELPQLVNVLRGEMSLVGPRPHPLALDEHFRHRLQLFDARYRMLPGITGLAQVNGCRGETDTLEKMQQRLDFDLLYIRNWSLWLDLKILLLTMAGRFTHPNAY